MLQWKLQYLSSPQRCSLSDAEVARPKCVRILMAVLSPPVLDFLVKALLTAWNLVRLLFFSKILIFKIIPLSFRNSFPLVLYGKATVWSPQFAFRRWNSTLCFLRKVILDLKVSL